MDYRVAQYSKYKQCGGKGDWNSGVLMIKLSVWDEFHEVTAQLLDVGDFVWRGQDCDKPLKSKFDRVVTSDRKTKLKKHLKAFVYAIRGRRGNNPPKLSEENIWALGRHYGLETPLLDWTESPFVAAYFAFFKENQNEAVSKNDVSPRFIYGLSKDIERWGPADFKGGGPHGHYIKFVTPDSDEIPRLLSQRGLFTIPLSADIDIEETVARCYSDDKRKNKSRIIFVRIQIPGTERKICLRNLNSMNINHATLFPDLIGAAEYCNLKLEIENYS